MDLAKMAFAVATMVAAAPGFLDSRAADFPLAGGDLSLAGNWGGEMPGKSDPVAIINDGTYTASSDLAFGALSVNVARVTFDFSQTPSRKVVFDGSSQKALAVTKTESQTVFKGGEWSVAEGKDCMFYCGAGDKTGGNNHEVILDNCVWTNLDRVYMGQAEGACRMDMRNSSRVYAKKCFVGNGSKTGNCLFISGGSEMHLSDSENPFYSDNGAESSSDTGEITVSGEGSLLSAPSGIFQIGNTHPDIRLSVSDNASVVAGSFVVGRTATSKRCRVQVSDGASFAANTKIEIKGENSRMIVANAALTVQSFENDAFTVGCAGLKGQSFSLSGADSSLSFFPSKCDVFAAGAWDAEFAVEDGAKWSLPEHARIAVAATNCAFKVANGGEVSLKNRTGTFEFGPGSSTDNPKFSVSNRIEVCGGGTLGIGGLRLSGTCNSLVVSNATVVCETRNEDTVLHELCACPARKNPENIGA